jgi:hypothetical protein
MGIYIRAAINRKGLNMELSIILMISMALLNVGGMDYLLLSSNEALESEQQYVM